MNLVRRPHSLLAAMLVAGCAVPVPPGSSPAPRATAPARPSAAPSAAAPSAAARPTALPLAGPPPVIALPSAAPVPLASAIAPPTLDAPPATPRPGASANPFAIPRTVAIKIPAGLQALTGMKLIGMDGSTMVAAGAGNYRLQAATAGPGAAFLLGINTLSLLYPLAIVNAILFALAPLNLQPDVPVTFDDNERPGQKLTVVLRVAADHARLEAFRAATVDPARQFFGLRFTDAAHGKVVMRSLPGDPGERNLIAESWDFTTGNLVADGSHETPRNGEGVKQRTNSHWELGGAPDDSGAVFGLRATMTLRKGVASRGPETLAFAANFAATGGGAHWVKAATPDNEGQAFFLPADGQSWGQTSPEMIGFYVGPDGKDLGAAAPAALKAILPAAGLQLPAYPLDPDAGDPFADPRFAFPD